MSRTLLCLIASVLVGGATLPEPASAQNLPARRDSRETALLRRRVVLLEDRVAMLERQIAAMQDALREQRDALQTRAALPPGPTYLELDRPDGWKTRENWRLLRRGLSQLEVRYLLGAPGGMDTSDLFTMWYYPDPRGGRVRFDALGGRLESWSEPW